MSATEIAVCLAPLKSYRFVSIDALRAMSAFFERRGTDPRRVDRAVQRWIATQTEQPTPADLLAYLVAGSERSPEDCWQRIDELARGTRSTTGKLIRTDADLAKLRGIPDWALAATRQVGGMKALRFATDDRRPFLRTEWLKCANAERKRETEQAVIALCTADHRKAIA